MNGFHYWRKNNKGLFLVLSIWMIVFIIGISLLIVVKSKKSTPQVAGISTDSPAVDTPTDAPTDLPTATPYPTSDTYSNNQSNSVNDNYYPTPAPSLVPTSTPIPVTATPTPTPSPTATPTSYQAVVSVSPSNSQPADGVSSFSISVHVADQNNNAIGGATVGLSSDSNVIFNPTDAGNSSTDASGNATFTASSSVANTYTLVVLVYHTSVNTSGTTSIVFMPVSTPTPSPTPSPSATP